MSFMKQTIDRTLYIWDECMNTPFVQELKKGVLPLDKFKRYIIQDSIYLKHYARIYGKAIYHSTTLKDIQLYYSVLCFVTDTESAVRLNYLKQFGITDDDIEFIEPLPENQNYINFMIEAAESGNATKILMALLPCLLSYNYIFRKILNESKIAKSRYLDLITDYANDQYYEVCKKWCDFADVKCKMLSENEKEEMRIIFDKASLLELDFWKMAYGE